MEQHLKKLLALVALLPALVFAQSITATIANNSSTNFNYNFVVRDGQTTAGTLHSNTSQNFTFTGLGGFIRLNSIGASSIVVVAAVRNLVKIKNKNCFDTNNQYQLSILSKANNSMQIVINNCNATPNKASEVKSLWDFFYHWVD